MSSSPRQPHRDAVGIESLQMGKSKDMKRERLRSPFNWIRAYRPLAVLWPVNIRGAAVRGERAWPHFYIFTLLHLHTGQLRLSLL